MRTVSNATGRFIRVSPSKARLVADLIRSKQVGEALSILQHAPQAAARLIEKVLRSAIANAEHNHQVRGFEELRVGVVVDGGPVLKRVRPRAMGRAFWIRHRTSHIAVTLLDAEEPRPRVAEVPERRSNRGASRGTASKAGAASSATRPGRRRGPAGAREAS